MLQEMQFHYKFTFYVDPKNYVYYAILIFLEHRQDSVSFNTFSQSFAIDDESLASR